MADPWVIKQHDTWPNWVGQIRDRQGNAIDLTNATSAKLLRRPSPAGSVQTLTLTIVSPASLGQVMRDWQTGDNATATAYDCEVEITWNDGSVQTIPNKPPFYTMTVEADLG